MTRTRLILLSLLSALLLFFSWPAFGVAPLIFIAWMPLLFIEDYFFQLHLTGVKKKTGRGVFGYAYLAFFVWNACATWWIWNATAGGAVLAIMANALLMALVFLFYHHTKKRMNGKFSGIVLVAYWITFEYVHMHWDLSWTWLTLGNVFAKYCNMVQWYEYTGVFGGSLWVLALNVMVFDLYRKRKSLPQKKVIRYTGIIFLSIIAPILISYLVLLKTGSSANGPLADVVVVQPNIDPYNEKFSGNYQEQLGRMLQLAEQKLDSTTDFVVFPETALQEGIWEDEMDRTWSIRTLKEFIRKHPRVKIVTGASTARTFQPGEKISATARKFGHDNTWFDDYNTAFYLDSTGKVQVYHKSILVPGVEKMPFPSVLGWLEDLAIKMGGTSGSLGTQEERTVFTSPGEKAVIAPVICYESIYGEFVGRYVRGGANLIFIITNDGWWFDTPGYRQHMAYASLRAIETRRCIARAANTGISCFINEFGQPSQQTKWWEPSVIRAKLPLLSAETFYVKHGDYIALFFCSVTILLCAFAFYLRFSKRSL